MALKKAASSGVEGGVSPGENQLLHVVGVGLMIVGALDRLSARIPFSRSPENRVKAKGERALASTPARLQHEAEDKRIDQQEQERRDDDPDAAQHGVAITQFDLAPGHDQQEPDATGETGRYQEGTTHRKKLSTAKKNRTR